MIIVFPSHPPGASGRKAVNYLVNKKDRGVEAEVLRGDPGQTIDLIESLEFKHTYTFGVCSFEPGREVSPEIERDVMDRFENAAFAGLDKDQYNILWVKHTDKAHHELHFIVPRVELSTGRAFNIAPPGSIAYFNALGDSINFEYGFADPRAGTRRRELALPQHGEKLRAEAERLAGVSKMAPRMVLHERLVEFAEKNRSKGLTREDLVAHLKEEGMEVPRVGDKYITVRIPGTDTKWRLKGAMYEKGWDSSKLRSLERDDTVRTGAQPEKARDARVLLEEMKHKRAAHNLERYGRGLDARLVKEQLQDQLVLQKLRETELRLPAGHKNREQVNKIFETEKNLLGIKALDALNGISYALTLKGSKKKKALTDAMERKQQVFKEVEAFRKPADPQKQVEALLGSSLPGVVARAESRNQARELVTRHVERQLGRTPGRDEVIAELEKSGFRVTRKGEGYLAIENPLNGERLRLKGGFYSLEAQSQKLIARVQGLGALTPAKERGAGEDGGFKERLSKDLDGLEQGLERLDRESEQAVERLSRFESRGLGFEEAMDLLDEVVVQDEGPAPRKKRKKREQDRD
ncbi:MAG: relaxase/mobilization nuclease domain-containing protein [Proteobacteria bacterium]|nr:relaxase/mobilization nuclease domain-containing protein [Pseudomonadota bacterium]